VLHFQRLAAPEEAFAPRRFSREKYWRQDWRKSQADKSEQRSTWHILRARRSSFIFSPLVFATWRIVYIHDKIRARETNGERQVSQFSPLYRRHDNSPSFFTRLNPRDRDWSFGVADLSLRAEPARSPAKTTPIPAPLQFLRQRHRDSTGNASAWFTSVPSRAWTRPIPAISPRRGANHEEEGGSRTPRRSAFAARAREGADQRSRGRTMTGTKNREGKKKRARERERERGGAERLSSPPSTRDPATSMCLRNGITDSKFFISERRKCRWRREAIDPGDDRRATAVSLVGRAGGDDPAASGRRRQTTRGEHAAIAGRRQHPYPAGDTRLRDEVSGYRSPLLRSSRFLCQSRQDMIQRYRWYTEPARRAPQGTANERYSAECLGYLKLRHTDKVSLNRGNFPLSEPFASLSINGSALLAIVWRFSTRRYRPTGDTSETFSFDD